MKYLIYLRVSTEKQDEETQLDYCLNFIKNRENNKEFKYEVFRDKKTSKKKLFEREGGKELFDRLNDGDIIIAIRLDRIARGLTETTLLVDRLEKQNSEILLVDQPGIKNKIMLGLYAGMAEEEIKLLRKRIKEKIGAKKKKGERYSRYLPYGYALHETKMVPIRKGDEIIMKRGVLVPVYEEQKLLDRIYDLADEGHSYGRMAKILNDQGYRNREGNPFQKMSIYRILVRKEQAMLGGQSLEESTTLQFH